MKFRRGSKVEVLVKKDHPCCAWRVGEITFENADSYDVSFDREKGIKYDIVEVSKKDVRPPSPALGYPDSWNVGDLVEVLDGVCWKTATIVRRNLSWYLVRLVGDSKEFRVRKSKIRLRLLWEDGNWIRIGQATTECNAEKIVDQDFCAVRATGGKRSIYAPTCAEEPLYNDRRVKAKRREDVTNFKNNLRNGIRNTVAAAYTREKKFIDYEVDGRWLALFENERVTSSYCLDSFLLNDANSEVSSVGSCSANEKQGDSNNAADFENSDAESVYPPGEELNSLHFPVENGESKDHKVELHTYRCTLETLFASGPLTWEQEALLTNLRISLNVSNDEHLIQVRIPT